MCGFVGCCTWEGEESKKGVVGEGENRKKNT